MPTAPFDYTFADEDYARKFAAEQRTKEIGVRKVMGASVFNIWRLLSKEFAMLVIVSLVIATPIAYFFMYNWLQNYQYRSGIVKIAFVSLIRIMSS